MCRSFLAVCCGLGLSLSVCPRARADEETAQLRNEVAALRELLAEQRRSFEGRIRQLEARIEQVSSGKATPQQPSPTDLQAALEQARGQTAAPADTAWPDGRLGAAMQSLNPAMSVIVDTFYHSDDSKEGIRHIFEEISGFGHTDGDGHEHEDGALEDGFNLRHLELYLSADVDPYFRGWAIGAISEESAELEEAVIQSTSLPAGLQLQGGKFLSNVSRMNAQHPHQWDFVDAPLVHQLLLGDHGLNEKGLQLSWLAPTPFQLRLGIEALQGGNEQVAQYHGEDAFDRKAGPRLWIGWAKVAPNLPERHGLEVGLAVGRGVHQEEHDEFDNADTVPPLTEGADGDTDHWFDGHSTFVGADIVYKYDAPKEHGAGDVTLQSGYLWRRRDLELVDHFFAGAPVGESRVDTQDGYYAQATYGFLPRWRTGLRWEQIGMVNHSDLPDGTDESFGESRRLSAILDFLPSESSRLRLQVARGDYDTAEGDEEVWQVFVQWMISLGRHGSAGHRCGHTDHHAHECSGHAHE